jgi:hypothetical protein
MMFEGRDALGLEAERAGPRENWLDGNSARAQEWAQRMDYGGVPLGSYSILMKWKFGLQTGAHYFQNGQPKRV